MLSPGRCLHSPAGSAVSQRAHTAPPTSKEAPAALWCPRPEPSLQPAGLGHQHEMGPQVEVSDEPGSLPSRSVVSPFFLAPKQAHAQMCAYIHTCVHMYDEVCTHTRQVVLVSGTKIFGKKQNQAQANTFCIPDPNSPDISFLIKAANNGEEKSLDSSHRPWKAWAQKAAESCLWPLPPIREPRNFLSPQHSLPPTEEAMAISGASGVLRSHWPGGAQLSVVMWVPQSHALDI